LTTSPGRLCPTEQSRSALSPQSSWRRHAWPAFGPLAHVVCGALKSGAALPRPMPFGTLASRAAVVNRILPSSTLGAVGSPAMPLHTPAARSVTALHAAPSFAPPTHFPVMVDTGCCRTNGTQFAFRTHGPSVPQSASFVHMAPPG